MASARIARSVAKRQTGPVAGTGRGVTGRGGPQRRSLIVRVCASRTLVTTAVIVIYVVALAFAIPRGCGAVTPVTVGGYLLAVAASGWLQRYGR